MSLLDSYIKYRDKAPSQNADSWFSWLPRWVKCLVCVCLTGSFIVAIVMLMDGGSTDITLAWFGITLGAIMGTVCMVGFFYPFYCEFRMRHIGRKLAKELATEWLSDQTGLSLSLDDSVLCEGTVDVLNVRYHWWFRSLPWTITVTYYSTKKEPSDNIIYMIDFDEYFNITRVIQYQKSSQLLLK